MLQYYRIEKNTFVSKLTPKEFRDISLIMTGLRKAVIAEAAVIARPEPKYK